MRKSRTSQSAISTHERELKALELRKAGVDFSSIAEKLGYSNASGAYKAVCRVMARAQREAGTDALELELTRLDDMLRSVWANARSGKVAHVDRVLKIVEQRAKLLGLAPQKVEMSGPDGGPIETSQTTGVVMLPPEEPADGEGS